MTTYPDEVWPTDSAVEALDGTVDAVTGLPFIAKGVGPTSSPSYEVQYNRRQVRQNRILAGWRQGMVVDEGSLKIGVYPVRFTLAGARKVFEGATGVSIPDDSTRVVYVDSSSALQTAADWPADIATFLPLAEVVTRSGQMTIEDRRVWAAFHVPSGGSLGGYERRMVTAYCASVGSSESGTEVFEFDPNADMTLEEVQVYCTATASTASVDVKEAGTTVLSAAATPSAGAVVKPTISDGSISSANNVTVHVTTDGSGSIANLAVTLVFKTLVTA